MALRRLLAERISGLKKAGVEVPVITEKSIPAVIISQDLLVSEEVLREGRLRARIPGIAKGTAYGESAGAWYRVYYPRTIHGAVPVCVARARGGEIPTPKAPSIVISKVAVPKPVPVEITPITIPYSNQSFPWYTGKPEALVNTLNDMTRMLYHLQGTCYGPYPHKGEGMNYIVCHLNHALGKIAKAIQDTNASFNDFRGKVESALDEQRKKIETAVNRGLARVLPLLYRAWGISSNVAVTPIHIRNETDTGFDFQSYGKTTIHYIAVGTIR